MRERGLGAPLRVVLGAGAPHERVFELLRQRAVQLVAQVVGRDAPPPRAQHHRVRKVGLMPCFLGKDPYLRKVQGLGVQLSGKICK